MIGGAQGRRVGITGLGVSAPDRIVTNDELSDWVDTSDEWIRSRTGIAERRVAEPGTRLIEHALPSARAALDQAGVTAADIDLVIVATVTPDNMFPATACTLAAALGAERAAAYDLSAGCTGFVYGLVQAYAAVSAGAARRALVVGGDLLSRITDWKDRGTAVLFGDGAGAVVLEQVEEGGILAVELGADGDGGQFLYLDDETSGPGRPGLIRMDGRQVFRFATRVLVDSARAVLNEAGRTVEDVNVYVPHQANRRIIEHATAKLGLPAEKTVVNVDRYGNTSSGSIPLALFDAQGEGRLVPGALVLMTGMGAGLTWGSVLLEWSMHEPAGPKGGKTN